jgi:uncharacterized membrane protein
MKIITRIRPEKFFVVAGFVLATLLLVITPPFQAPDEINHFYRAWQVADGQLTGVKSDDRLGGTIPASVEKTALPFLHLRHNMNRKTDRQEIYAASHIPLHSDSLVFRDFPNTALYTPVSYAPQAVTIFVLRSFHCPPLYMLYATRVVTLLVWLIVIYYAIVLLPAFRWLFALLALLPMSLFANMAMSADMVTNATAFFTIAYILHCAYAPGVFTRKHLIVMLVLAFLLASAKIVYLPLLALLFLVPREKFSSRKSRLLHISSIALFALLVAACWSGVIGKLYTPYAAYNPRFRDGLDLMPGANVSGQIDHILTHDTFILRAILRSLKESAEMYVPGYVGTFGWLDTDLPHWLIVTAYCMLLFTALSGDRDGIRWTGKQRAFLLALAFLLVSVVITSQLLSWEAVGSGRVMILQGRYFIPVFPVLFLFIASFAWRSLTLTPLLVMLFVLISGSVSIASAYNRYYVDAVNESMTIRCGAEEQYGYDYFRTDQPGVYLENATYTRRNTRVRNGNYAFAVDTEHPFSAAYPFYNLKAGDSLYAEVWRYGDTGAIALVCDTFSAPVVVSERDAAGWQKISAGIRFPEDPSDKVMLFLWNAGSPSAYFDDLEIRCFKVSAGR